MGFLLRRQAFVTATAGALLAFALAGTAGAADVCEALWRARNAIFANKGYCFESPEGQAVFGKSCFPPYGKLTREEEADVQRIRDVEAHQRCAPTPSGITSAATAPASNNVRVVPKYVVQLALSRAAANKLTQSGETVRIAAFYYGSAVGQTAETESGEIALANEAIDLPSGTTAANLGGISIPEAEIGKTSEGQPMLLINVYTSRKVFQDNLFDCGIYQGPAAQAGQVSINCKLIGE